MAFEGTSSWLRVSGGSASRRPMASTAWISCCWSCGMLALDALDLLGGARDVEPGDEPALGPRLHDVEDVLVDLGVGLLDADLLLDAAELHVVARELRKHRDERRATRLGGRVDHGLAGLDVAPHATPQVQLPRGVEARRVALEGVAEGLGDAAAGRRPRRGAAEGARRHEADEAVLAELLAVGVAGAVDGRQRRRRRGAELGAALAQAQRRGLDVEVLLGHLGLEPGQDGIAEGAPPQGVGLGRCGAGEDLERHLHLRAVVEVGLARDDGRQRRDVFGPHRAAPRARAFRGGRR